MWMVNTVGRLNCHHEQQTGSSSQVLRKMRYLTCLYYGHNIIQWHSTYVKNCFQKKHAATRPSQPTPTGPGPEPVNLPYSVHSNLIRCFKWRTPENPSSMTIGSTPTTPTLPPPILMQLFNCSWITASYWSSSYSACATLPPLEVRRSVWMVGWSCLVGDPDCIAHVVNPLKLWNLREFVASPG